MCAKSDSAEDYKISTTPGAGKYISGFETGMTQSLHRLAELVAPSREPVVSPRGGHT